MAPSNEKGECLVSSVVCNNPILTSPNKAERPFVSTPMDCNKSKIPLTPKRRLRPKGPTFIENSELSSSERGACSNTGLDSARIQDVAAHNQALQ